jgi:glutaredoxin|tara:strand:- start:137 stop:469 length:333 start_codon:yes stop_codon:yes gene_type:complete
MDCLNIYSLDGCYYSQSLEELLNSNKIKYNLNRVNLENKSKIKEKNKMSTFPQVFLNSKNVDYKVGGFDDVNYILDEIKTKNNLDLIIKNVNFKTNLDKKRSIRLINLLI